MHVLNNGITEINEKGFLKKLLCKHTFVEGELCSPNGMVRISGKDLIKVCRKCGKVAYKKSINY